MEKSPPGHAKHHSSGGNDLWVDGLLCAYECIPVAKHQFQVGGKLGQKSEPMMGNSPAEISIGVVSTELPAIEITMGKLVTTELPVIGQSNNEFGGPDPDTANDHMHLKIDEGSNEDRSEGDLGAAHSRPAKELRKRWVPIGWDRIAQLVEYVQRHSMPSEDMLDGVGSGSDDGSGSVVDQAAPFRQSQMGPIWWCHVLAGHPDIMKWLTDAQWLHPAIRSGLRDESRLISERMKHLFYEVPVRAGGGLLFELLGHSVGDSHRNEDDVPIVLRSWASLNFLVTAMHVKGSVPNGLNVIGISEVQDAISAGGASAPQTAHEVVAFLADRLARWDDRHFRKNYFGVADEVELKFVNRRGDEDLAVLNTILNQEIKRLSTQVIRVKWALHVREEISYELLAHLGGKKTQAILKRIATRTKAMLEEQEAVCERLFNVQDVMRSTFHASLQGTSVRIMHNLAVLGSGGLCLNVIVGLFGINLGGIPGAQNSPLAFGLFTVACFIFGVLLFGLGVKFLQFKRLPTEEQLTSRKKELQNLVTKFQKSAQAHEKVREIPNQVFSR